MFYPRQSSDPHLENAHLRFSQIKSADLRWAYLENATLRSARLEGTNFFHTHLEQAKFIGTHLEETNLCGAFLDGAVLENAIFSNEKHIGPCLADSHWENVNLATVQWSQIRILGDEYEARQNTLNGKRKDKQQNLNEYEKAVRANRQLASVLQDQGLNEDAARFAYRAQVLQKAVFRFQIFQSDVKLRYRVRALQGWLFSWFLFLLAGYGYRLGHSFLTYMLVIIGFTTTYYLLGASFNPPLSLVNALGLSMTSFHGRGFFPGVTQLNDILTILASIEAFVGLILEATFIATLTQRFFGR